MATSVQKTLCRPDLLDAREQQFERLRQIFTGTQPERPFYLWGELGTSETDPQTDPGKWLSECLEQLAARAEGALDQDVFRPLVIEYGPYGVHFIDRIFGAEVYWEDGNWWSRELNSDVGSLSLPDLEKDPTWELARKVALEFCATEVTAPLFGLPTLSSALNIAVNLYSDRFLMALALEPEAAEHDLEIIQKVLVELHHWYLKTIPLEQLQPVVAYRRTQPPGYGQLCGCTCHLVSARHYADSIIRFDQELLEVYPQGGMIHLCGAHTQHIPAWKESPLFRAFQINDRAAEDFHAYYQGLREDQVIYFEPTGTLSTAEVLEATGGRRVVFVTEPS